MGTKVKNKQRDNQNYIESLIEDNKKRLKAGYAKAKSYLEENKFFEKTIQEKTEFLITKEGLELIENMYGVKMPTVQVAYCFELSQEEFDDIRRNNPKIYDAMERGMVADIDEVEERLKDQATGYFVTETRTKKFYNERTGRESSQDEEYKRFIPANFQAASYILNNKRQKEWKDRQVDLEIAKNTIKIELVTLGDDELNLE